MTYRALYLVSDSQADETVIELLKSRCTEVHVVSAIAQATALIESPSHDSDGSDSTDVIVADVAAGGTALAEFVVERYASESPAAGLDCARPLIVLIDDLGDVQAARKALRLRVNAYLLPSDSPAERIVAIDRLLSAQRKNCAETGSARSSPSSGSGNGGYFGIGNGSGGDTGAALFDMSGASRLSQIESAIMSCLSAHTGLPMSARSIVSHVMGREMDEDKAASLIRPHISRLRSKVEPTPQMPQRLLTVRGKGYMFVC
jgi:DNA-binding response OmpR family regulator